MSTSPGSFPDIADHDLYNNGVPHELFARMRRESPVWVHEPAKPGFDGGPGYWFIGKHADVSFVTQNPQIFSSEDAGTMVRDIPDPKHLTQVRQQLPIIHPLKPSRM